MKFKKTLFLLSCYFIVASHIAMAQAPATPGFTTVNVLPANVCAGMQVNFKDTSTVTFTSWQWTFPGGTPHTSTGQNPVIEYDTAGVYNVILRASSIADSGTLKVSNYITVTQPGKLNVTANPSSVCEGQPSVLSVTSGNGSYTWKPSSGLLDSTGASTVTTPAVTTTYTVIDGSLCPAIGTVVLSVANNTIGGNIAALTDTLCANKPANLTLTGNSGGDIQWQWSSTNTGGYADIAGAVNETKLITDPLSESTWFRVIVGNGACIAASDSLQICVEPLLTASFSVSANGNTVSFNSDASSGLISDYTWTFGDGQGSKSPNPHYTYATNGIFTACLTVNPGGLCSDSVCHTFDLQKLGVSEIAGAGSWNIYPSPFTGVINIESKTATGKVEAVTLYNMLGQALVNKNTGNSTGSTIQLDGSAFDRGVYYLHIKTAETTYVQKVVKQ